ncbi:MAG: hypothetical protein HC863_01060 [Myxococcales bacterium]|nr:hypothetical protein [Myxococcales bacterium]
MNKTPGGWTVIDPKARVLTYQYAFNDQGSTSNCFVARMGNGQLLVVSPAYRMTDAGFKELDEHGEVGAIVANNGFHHLGLAEWKARYPKARLFASPLAQARIQKKNPQAPKLESLDGLSPLLGEDVTFTDAPATKCGESWVTAKIAGGVAWFVSDLLINLPKVAGPLPMRLLFKWTDSGPGFKVFHLTMKFTVKDKKQVLTALAAAMAEAPPTVIVPAHGAIMDQGGVAQDAQKLLASFL